MGRRPFVAATVWGGSGRALRKTGAREQSREGEDGGRTEGRGQARTAGALHAVPAGM